MKSPAPKIVIAAFLCAALALAGLPAGTTGAEAQYDAATGATSATPPSAAQAPISAKLRAVQGNRATGSFTGTLSARKGQFTGTLKLPLPNAALGITDATTARAADLVLEIARRGQVYVRCDLFFTALTKNPRAAKFSLAVISRRGIVQQQTGLCELATPPYGSGMPTPLKRDTLTVKSITADGERIVSTGTFK